jgi:chromosomal replication initiator protein
MVAVDMATESQLRTHQDRKARLARMGGNSAFEIAHRFVPQAVDPVGVKVEVPVDVGGLQPDPRLTFDSFCIGSANKIAHAAVLQIGERTAERATQYNPLVIHGGKGVGKTHLLHAAANALKDRAVLLSAERFFSFASTADGRSNLRRELLRFDTVLIDDIHSLSGKAVQAELQYYVRHLCDLWRQVVLTSETPVREIEKFGDEIVDRLSSGLELSLGDQEFELRIDITQAKAAGRVYLADDLIDQVARAAFNGRDVDGIVNKLAVTAILGGQEINADVVAAAAEAVVSPAEIKRILIEDVQRVVCRHYGVSKIDMCSQRRTSNIVKPRQIAMYLCKTMTMRSLPEIGRRFGNRDHTTALHAVRKISAQVASSTEIAFEVNSLKATLEDMKR